MTSDTPIDIGPFNIGRWIRDCSTLKSKVQLSENRPSVSMELKAASPLGSIVSAIPGLDSLANKVNKLGSLKGNFSIEVSAQPYTISCTNNKQTVGYSILIIVKGGIYIAVSGAEMQINATLPFSVEGEHEDCNCNASINPLASAGTIKTELKTLIPIPNSTEESYALASMPLSSDNIFSEKNFVDINEMEIKKKGKRSASIS